MARPTSDEVWRTLVCMSRGCLHLVATEVEGVAGFCLAPGVEPRTI